MEQQTDGVRDLLRAVGFPIYQGRNWIKFLGVLSIIQGIVMVFTLVGIIIAWLPIWMGVILYQSAAKMEQAYVAGDKGGFYDSMSKLKLYFVIQGVMALIGIIFAIFALSVGMLGVILDAVR